MSLLYEKYLSLSSKYFLFSGLSDNDTEDTIKEKSYYILNYRSTDDKINHNLSLSQKNNDREYLNYHNSIIKSKNTKIKIILKEKKKEIGGDGEIERERERGRELIKALHKYIYDNNLQSTIKRHIIIADDYLSKKLSPLKDGDENYTYYNLKKYVIFE